MNDIINLLFTTLRMSTPLILAGMGGLIGERSGVLNIGLEGMMLTGSFAGVLGSYLTQNAWMGLLFGVFAGMFMAMIHAFISITCGGNQTISGIGINMLAIGLTSFGLRAVFGRAGSSDTVPSLPEITFLKDIPVMGKYLGSLSPYVYLALVFVAVVWFVFYKTPVGLRLRITGEDPRVAETAGVDVWKLRYISMLVCGALAGMGGAYLSVAQMNLFQESMVSGRGFLAMAAIIMGKWTPLGTLASSLFFGFFDALQLQLQLLPDVTIPSEFMRMLPYVMCLIALCGFIGKAESPNSITVPYLRKKKKRIASTKERSV